MNLIAIDPGRTTGWASFQDGVLLGAGAYSWGEREALPLKLEAFQRKVIGAAVTRVSPFVLIEVPRWYPHDQVDTNDLIDLAVKVGEFKAFFQSLSCTVDLVFPRTWKGTVKKEIMTERILGKLTPDELARVPLRPRAKTPDHNCVDAIGLGLWKLGRLR